MSQDIVLSNIKKFMQDFDKANKADDSRVPFKDMFTKIRDDLKSIHDAISSDRSSLGEKTDSMGKLVNNLNEVLQECLAVLKKHKGSTRNCLNYISSAQLLSVKKHREKLQSMMNDFKQMLSELPPLETISTSIEEKPLQRTYGDVDETKIFGWDKLAKKIINESLLKKNEEGLNVVGIVGMFGSGKTTLAQKIYLSDEVIDHFPLRLWVWVSAKCDKEELIRRTLDNLGVDDDQIDKTLEIDPKLDKIGVLLFLLFLELSKRRYLIVFDDVVNIENWHCELEKEPPEDETKEWMGRLAYGLPKGCGSAIIITSRKEDDARKMVGLGDIYSPEPLLGEDGWTLFKHSYEEVATFHEPKLESLREEITKKCAGLPLALKAAGERMAQQKMHKENEAIQVEVSSLPNQQEIEAEASSLTNKQEIVAEASSLSNKQEEIEDGASIGAPK